MWKCSSVWTSQGASGYFSYRWSRLRAVTYALARWAKSRFYWSDICFDKFVIPWIYFIYMSINFVFLWGWSLTILLISYWGYSFAFSKQDLEFFIYFLQLPCDLSQFFSLYLGIWLVYSRSFCFLNLFVLELMTLLVYHHLKSLYLEKQEDYFTSPRNLFPQF